MQPLWLWRFLTDDGFTGSAVLIEGDGWMFGATLLTTVSCLAHRMELRFSEVVCTFSEPQHLSGVLVNVSLSPSIVSLSVCLSCTKSLSIHVCLFRPISTPGSSRPGPISKLTGKNQRSGPVVWPDSYASPFKSWSTVLKVNRSWPRFLLFFLFLFYRVGWLFISLVSSYDSYESKMS